MDTASIKIQLEFADVRDFGADVLILKYAQSRYGVDKVVSDDLLNRGVKIGDISPRIGHSNLVENVGKTKFKKILFVGVEDIYEFGYGEIKKFSERSLNILAEEAPEVTHVAMTIHGVGYGLDENEAFLSQIAGIFNAIQNRLYPKNLTKISIVENRNERLIRLGKVLDGYINNQSSIIKERKYNTSIIDISLAGKERIDHIITAGEDSSSKKHIFVAMPFKIEMNNTFYFGIQDPVHKNEFLCSRIDQEVFTGDILDEIKNKIKTASAVIADLTTQNPNVYLEIGYAWGIGKPTILLIEENDTPRFDLIGQRHLKYGKENLKELQEKLTKEIRKLVQDGLIK